MYPLTSAHGILGKFSGASLEALCVHPDVQYIEEDAVEEADAVVTQ